MSKPMPKDIAVLNGPYAPINMECDCPDLYIEGEIPESLFGSFYRCGPNTQFAPRSDDYHFFSGDGMVHAFHIENGKVSYNNRWVRTTKWRIENELGRNVLNPMNPFDCEPEFSDFVLTDKEGLANTSPVWHGGKLMITEEGHLPMSVDPETLETKGPWNFFGKMNSAMTAHPKIDPKTGDMYFFAYMSQGPFNADVAIYTVDKAGVLLNSVIIETPHAAMIHDFIVTENYIMIPLLPLTGSLDRAMQGLPPFAWEPEKGTFVGLLPRDGGAEDIRWVESDTRFMFHIMNGYEKDGLFICDVCETARAPLFPNADGTPGEDCAPSLHRWTIDLKDPAARLQSECINDLKSEFPQVDPRYLMSEYRYGIFLTPQDPNVHEAFFNAVARIDHKTGQVQKYDFGAGRVTSEAIFVPKSEDAPEGDGYVLCVVLNPDTQTSELDVFDAQTLEKGPVGVAKLTHRVPLGFHGSWRPGK